METDKELESVLGICAVHFHDDAEVYHVMYRRFERHSDFELDLRLLTSIQHYLSNLKSIQIGFHKVIKHV